jgi:N-acetylglucosamine kinase-like BadF-type ATPase
MILLADSGSTKTTWTLLEGRSVVASFQTAGMNPYFISFETVQTILKADIAPKVRADVVKEIHFYGAGCSTENNNNMLRDAMKLFFRKASIYVYHDILGAARSLLGREKGIACILGTGCNACYYDGEEVFSKVPSLGYLFGDEGAGSNLGKIFMEKYLKNKLPEEIRNEFERQYKLSLEDILNALYNKPFPNRFLASFSEFIAPQQDHPFIHDLVKNSFQAFIDEQIRKYQDYENLTTSFVGSIAWHYKDILLETAADNKLHVGTILKSPMEGLIRFHLNEE